MILALHGDFHVQSPLACFDRLIDTPHLVEQPRNVRKPDCGIQVDLAEEDSRTAAILELHYFAGMTYEEAGGVLDVSQATAKRALRFGKAWIRDYLEQDD